MIDAPEKSENGVFTRVRSAIHENSREVKMKFGFGKWAILVLWFSTILLPFNAFSQAAPSSSDWAKQTPEILKSGIEQKHPAAYYLLASKLFAAGQKEEAVFWFYAGQLRYRFYLKATPGLNPSGDPALFASLSETVGRPLNEYAFGDIPRLVKTIDEVLKWDETHENRFTSKASHPQDYADIRDGLVKLREHILKNQEDIKRQRKANGLENR